MCDNYKIETGFSAHLKTIVPYLRSERMYFMKKFTSIAIAITTTSLAVMAICLLRLRFKKNAELAKKLGELRDDLELDCNLILSTAKEIPEEIITTADREFKTVVDDAVSYASSIIFGVYNHLDEHQIRKLSLSSKEAYVDYIESFIQSAEKQIAAIDSAREKMNRANTINFGN